MGKTSAGKNSAGKVFMIKINRTKILFLTGAALKAVLGVILCLQNLYAGVLILLEMLLLATEGLCGVRVDCCEGLVIDYMAQNGIDEIFKGYRNGTDLVYERKMAEWNKAHGGYDTVLWCCPDGLSDISSSRAREALLSGKALEEILPSAVCDYLRKRS